MRLVKQHSCQPTQKHIFTCSFCLTRTTPLCGYVPVVGPIFLSKGPISPHTFLPPRSERSISLILFHPPPVAPVGVNQMARANPSHTHNTVTTSLPLPPAYWQTILRRGKAIELHVCGHSQPRWNNSPKMHNNSMKTKFKNNRDTLIEASKQTSNLNLKQWTPSFPGAHESQVHPKHRRTQGVIPWIPVAFVTSVHLQEGCASSWTTTKEEPKVY